MRADGLTLTGTIDEYQGANIASGATTDIGAATGNYVVVTGVTTITSFGTIQAGTRRIVTFSGILLLTYNAVSLILPTAADITTAVGDVATFVSLGSGNWICTSYLRADGTAVGGGGHEIQDNGTPMATEPALNFVRMTLADNPGVATVVTRPADTQVQVPASKPASPVEGDVWTDSETMKTYVWYDTYWVEKNVVIGAGDVTGPASASADNFASYDGISGKLIKDSGYNAGSFAPASANIGSSLFNYYNFT